ncbi:putative oxidoreductase [Hyaloraphidium curvatum]|nr:putative oxidoreductase [Hyaloraphidium curvatum]
MARKPVAVIYGGVVADEPLELYSKTYGADSMFDTARAYGPSEGNLGSSGWSKKVKIATKVFPMKRGGLMPAEIEASFAESLKQLQLESVDLFYVHWPDRSVPVETWLKAFDALHKAGKFKEFGLSNFAAWEVVTVVETAERLGLVKPTVYQGVYNLIDRSAEDELFPCLKKYGIRFYAYSPLAGGLLSSRYLGFTAASPVIPGSRFEIISAFKDRYWKDPFFDALRSLAKAAEKAGCGIEEACIRWLAWHSDLDGSKGDGYILGSSKPESAVANIEASKKGPLPAEVAAEMEKIWSESLSGVAEPYFMSFRNGKLVYSDP